MTKTLRQREGIDGQAPSAQKLREEGEFREMDLDTEAKPAAGGAEETDGDVQPT